MLTKLADAARCKDKASVWRAWCPATSWAKGKPGAPKPGVMVGVTVALAADTDVAAWVVIESPRSGDSGRFITVLTPKVK